MKRFQLIIVPFGGPIGCKFFSTFEEAKQAGLELVTNVLAVAVFDLEENNE